MRDNQEILKTLTPTYNGLIWLTPTDVSSKLEHFEQINYITDGVLTDQIKSQYNAISPTNLFILGQSFGHPFLVTILPTDKQAFKIDDIKSCCHQIKQLHSSKGKYLLVVDIHFLDWDQVQNIKKKLGKELEIEIDLF